MEDWDHFRVVLALARTKTLRGAAELLAVNHTTVARRLTSLTHYYQTELFERIDGSYQLTTTGLEVLKSAEHIEQIVDGAKRLKRANDVELSGKITLSLPTAIGQYLLLDELASFQHRYPNITLTIVASYQLADLDRCEADIVIRADNNPSEHLVGRRLCNIATCYYGAKQYIENTPIEQFSWITSPINDGVPNWIAHSPYPDAGISLQISDLDLRYHAGIAGYGLFRGACYMADTEVKLQRVHGCAAESFQDLWVLTHPDLRNVPRIKVLMDYISTALLNKKDLIEGKGVA